MTPTEWLLSGDTGVSSKTIFAVMTGSKMPNIFNTNIPHDSGDFGRCYRLLQKFPAWRARLSDVASAYPMWGPMVAAWDELAALYEAEMESEDDSESKLCSRIRELEDKGRIAAGWEQIGPGSWRSPKAELGGTGGRTTIISNCDY